MVSTQPTSSGEEETLLQAKATKNANDTESTTSRVTVTAATSSRTTRTRRTVATRRRPASRRRPERRPVTWNVDFGLPASFLATTSQAWIIQTVCKALWTHLLYARGLVPVPIHQLLQAAAGAHHDDCTNTNTSNHQRSSSRLSSSDRKMRHTGVALQELLQDCRQVTRDRDLNVRYVWLTLGASFTRPKEVYLLDFTTLQEQQDQQQQQRGILKEIATDSSKKEYALSTRLIRQVVQAECDGESQQSARQLLAAIQRASSDQLSVTFGVTTASFERLSARELNAFAAAGPVLLPKVIVRRDFSTNKRGVHRMARVRVFAKDGGEAPAVSTCIGKTDDLLLQVETQGITWLSLHSKVKGFRIPESALG